MGEFGEDMKVFIDVDDAMTRFGNNKKLYATLLKKFDGAAIITGLRNKFADGDAAGILEQAHMIKGVAANLSLRDLCEQAKAIELEIKNTGVLNNIDVAEISVATTDKEIKAWLSENA